MSFRKAPFLNAVAALALMTAASPAGAISFLGINFGGGDDTAQIEVIDPQPYEITFDIASDDSGVRSSLRQSTSLWTGRDTPASGSAGLISAAQADYRALLATLYTQGYYSGAISIRINGQEAASIPLTQKLPRPSKIVVNVDPGPNFRFGTTEIVNKAPKPDALLGEGGRTALDRFKPGRVARADVVDLAGEEEVTNWRRAGYPKARVGDRDVVADHRSNTLDVTIRMDPGREARFGEVTADGAGRVDPEFIRYMADIPTGDKFDPAAIDDAIDRLNRLRVFRSVRVEEAENITADGALPILIETQPRRPRRFGVGATLSSIDGIGVEAFWMHRNIGGKAERLRFDVSIDGIAAESDPGDWDYAIGASFVKPGLIDPETDFLSSIEVHQEVFETYREQAVKVELGLQRRYNDRMNTSAGLEVTYSGVEDDQGDREFLTFALPLTIEYDGRDVPLDATEGYYLRGELRPFIETNFETQALGAQVEGRTYVKLGSDKTVAAFRAGLGTIFGGELTSIPPSELYFTGGGGSIRGYAYRANGLEVDGNTVGGRSALELSTELRQKINNRFGLVAFMDGGVVSAETFPSGNTDFRWGAGLGARLYTGLGPIRVDIAAPVNGRATDPDFAFYVGIGQAF